MVGVLNTFFLGGGGGGGVWGKREGVFENLVRWSSSWEEDEKSFKHEQCSNGSVSFYLAMTMEAKRFLLIFLKGRARGALMGHGL